MPVKIVGSHSSPGRVITGLYTFDRAFTNKDNALGMPMGTGYEIFGLNHTGKSTFCYSLASILGRETAGNIALADFEGFDDVFLSRVATTCGFDGKIYIVSKEKDEEQLDGLIEKLHKDCTVGILDSIGAIAPMGESEGDIGESNMGRRAFLMAQFSRKGLKLFRFERNKTILMINHWYPKLGGYGYDTPGGEAKKYLATVRIKLQRKEEFPDKSYTLLGTVVKNRWGYQDLTFNAFVLAGYGLHVGMSALWDCVMLKMLKRVKGSLVTTEGESLGKLGHYAMAAKEGKTELFEVFFKLLEKHGKDNADNPGEDNEPEPVDEGSDGTDDLETE